MKKSSILAVLLVFLCLTVSNLFAETKQQPMTKTNTKSLYERLGGKETVKIVVEEFVMNVKTDKRVSTYFAKTDINKFKMNFENYICHKAGGPCKYEGKNMKEVHAGMGITESNYNAVVEDLSKAIDKAKIKQEDKKELLGFVSPPKTEMIENKKVEEKTEMKTEKKHEEKKTDKSGEKKSGY